eukprot:365752-Chlamydomonas_euryale.AAC.7
MHVLRAVPQGQEVQQLCVPQRAAQLHRPDGRPNQYRQGRLVHLRVSRWKSRGICMGAVCGSDLRMHGTAAAWATCLGCPAAAWEASWELCVGWSVAAWKAAWEMSRV